MTPPIERIRYYDGEYLRAFDFAAEQGYHVDMRRRLNMALHLYGIVEGLQLTLSSNAGITQVSINPGMAIDSYGREIFLLAPYTFDDQADVLANRITSSGSYQVWIQYSRIADTPPSVGYAACNETDQTTRWRETCKVVLLKSSGTPDIPAVTDDISEEDPDTDTSNGVFLGFVYVTPNSLTGAFSLPPTQPAQPAPVYIGLCAQQIQPPDFPDTVSAPFDITSSAGPLLPPLGVDVKSNLFVDQHLIVGENFDVTLPSGATPPATGNVKVAGDLFVNGDLFLLSATTGKWVKLADFITGLMPAAPDIQMNSFTVPGVPGFIGDLSSGSLTLTIPTTIKVIGSSPITAGISGVTFNTQANLSSISSSSPGLGINISVSASLVNTTANSGTFLIRWTSAPTVTGPPELIPITSLTISYVVVFYPQ